MLVEKKTLGSEKKALKLALKGYETIPAYQNFLDNQGIKSPNCFEDLPVTDKNNYILKYDFKELIHQNATKGYRIGTSSGSSGKNTYWLNSPDSVTNNGLKLRIFLESNFQTHLKPTLAIMALNYPAWAASENLDLALKISSMGINYTFYTFSCGIKLDSIIDVINLMNSDVEQIVIFIVPSTIFHLQERAKHLGYDLPIEKLRYIVVGEFFTENLRINLQNQAQVTPEKPFMYSFYGSSDTVTLGTESLASISLRKLLYQNPILASDLGFDHVIPKFFHLTNKDTFIETDDEGILVTQWDDIPLFRYLLSDNVSLYSWRDLKQEILEASANYDLCPKLLKIINNSTNYLPDILALKGRNDKCIVFRGLNIYEYLLDTIVRHQDLQDILTGIYYAKIIYRENGQQVLKFDLETKLDLNSQLQEYLYHFLINTLCKLYPDFAEDWETIYCQWEKNSNDKILDLNFHLYPQLSQNLLNKNKHQAIL
jgi:phenylacetate-CoA ligase